MNTPDFRSNLASFTLNQLKKKNLLFSVTESQKVLYLNVMPCHDLSSAHWQVLGRKWARRNRGDRRKVRKKAIGEKKSERKRGYSGVSLNLSFSPNYIHCLTAVLALLSFYIHWIIMIQAEHRGKLRLWEVIHLPHKGRKKYAAIPSFSEWPIISDEFYVKLDFSSFFLV